MWSVVTQEMKKEYRSKDAMQDGYIMDKGKQERG
jgi:hypothetical protein